MGAGASAAASAPAKDPANTSPTPENTSDAQLEELIKSRFHGLTQLLAQSGCRDAFCRFLCTEKFSEEFLTKAVSFCSNGLLLSILIPIKWLGSDSHCTNVDYGNERVRGEYC